MSNRPICAAMECNFDYAVVRSKRKTVTISVRDGKVTVKAPPRLSLDYIKNFVAQKSQWIANKLAEYKVKTDMFKPLADGASALINGCYYDIVPSNEHKRIALDEACGVLYMPIKYDGEGAERALVAWYKRYAASVLGERLKVIAQQTGLEYKSFALTNARTKWGSCDGACNIRLNWRLIMLDDALMRYVIVHELAHTVHHDHSAAFWAEVGKYDADYVKSKKRLKSYSVLTSMHR